MSFANKITLLRVILAPVFFFFYFIPEYFPSLFVNGSAWTIAVIWPVFIISEITDYFDGLAARKLNETSDIGKLFDPFADTLMQITCFFCFVMDGIFPAFLLLLLIYREFGILFLRILMLRKGVTLGARMSGKTKTVAYITTASVALLAVGLQRMLIFEFAVPSILKCALVFFIISVIISIVSFVDYFIVFRKTK